MGFPAAESSHFFQLILSDNVQDTGLKIPKKFIMEHGKNMSNRVSLCVPDGRLWKVKLINTNNGEVWFKKGWDEFIQHYSIEYGHFLVFRYQGNSVFHVIIFDASASEIEYPTNIVNGNCEMEGENSTRNKPPVTYLQHDNKKAKFDSVSTLSGEGNINGGFEDTRASTWKSVKLEEEMNPCPQDNGNKKVGIDTSIQRKTRANVAAKGMEALRLANAFKSNSRSPYSFTIIMQPSYVSYPYSLNITRDFFHKYLNTKNKNFTLQLSDGRTWPLKCTVYHGSAKLYFGWKTFVLDNSLARADVCVFELISKMENLLRVFIFRAS